MERGPFCIVPGVLNHAVRLRVCRGEFPVAASSAQMRTDAWGPDPSTRPVPPPLPTPLAATLLVASRAVTGTSVPSDWAWIVTRRDSCTLDSEERPPEVILISFRHPVSLLVLRLKKISV